MIGIVYYYPSNVVTKPNSLHSAQQTPPDVTNILNCRRLQQTQKQNLVTKVLTFEKQNHRNDFNKYIYKNPIIFIIANAKVIFEAYQEPNLKGMRMNVLIYNELMMQQNP